MKQLIYQYKGVWLQYGFNINKIIQDSNCKIVYQLSETRSGFFHTYHDLTIFLSTCIIQLLRWLHSTLGDDDFFSLRIISLKIFFFFITWFWPILILSFAVIKCSYFLSSIEKHIKVFNNKILRDFWGKYQIKNFHKIF